jgi:PAS domain-containing protein
MLGAINRLLGRKPRKPNAALLALTLNNMTQGVVLLDTSGRLMVCNDQYLAMYGLSPDVVKPGAALIDMIAVASTAVACVAMLRNIATKSSARSPAARRSAL